jgi:glycosyltransferase involved in cell wall biosynthesis
MSSARPLRLLLLVDHVTPLGGAERFVVGLATHLPRDRVEPWVCSTRHGLEESIHALTEAGVPHVNLGRDATWQVHRLAPLVALIRRERFDVLHCHKFGSNVWGTPIGRACRVPVVLAHEHTWPFTGDRLRMWLDGQLIGRLATRFLAVSERDRERMIELEGVPSNKVMVMPTAYIPSPSPAGKADIRTELGIAPDVPLVAIAAVLRSQKALDILLDAHARLVTRVKDAHLVIAGDGECHDRLEHQIERLGIGGSAHLVGPRSDVEAILDQADVGVLSSDWEGMPLFVFECMAAGIPLVATSVGGLPEIVDEGRTGLLVPPRDPAALADALERVLTDGALARRLADAAADRLEQFRIESVAVQFAELYEELAAAEKSSRG